jgi:hypothetical protein
MPNPISTVAKYLGGSFMTRTSESSWTPDGEKRGHNTPLHSSEDFDSNQRSKPMKAIIGVVLLVVLALILSRMNPAPHEISDPSVTTGQATGTDAR